MVTTIRHTLPARTAQIRNAATTVSDIDSGNHVPRGMHTTEATMKIPELIEIVGQSNSKMAGVYIDGTRLRHPLADRPVQITDNGPYSEVAVSLIGIEARTWASVPEHLQLQSRIYYDEAGNPHRFDPADEITDDL
ncbi:Uncharacterised protein [Acidipropionibacterium jensenii]|uniref:Uncharacterized protein n=1 Tax=Acidipropionibacterium jensenii TaxID=1749 RepID=A0A3S4YYL3_9ACTN|nr:hypothetical protein [Acidipropionibacterium jensenii]VEI04116.1 Uncharacterised protein [Acidipropionibacterium jensenii]